MQVRLTDNLFNEVLDQKFTKLNIPVMLGFKLAFLRITCRPRSINTLH